MLKRFLNRSVTSAETDASLSEVSSTVAGVVVMAFGVKKVFDLELPEEQRLLGIAVTVALGLAIVAIGQLSAMSVRLSAAQRPTA